MIIECLEKLKFNLANKIMIDVAAYLRNLFCKNVLLKKNVSLRHLDI